MIKKITIISVLILSLNSFSQELVGLIPLDLKKDRDVFQIVNESTKETTLFLSDKKRVKAIRLSEKMQVLDSMSAERPDSNYSNMIGTCGDKSNPMLFWASSNQKEIFTQKFNVSEHKILEQKYDLTFKNEKVLQSFSLNENFYIVSVVKETDILKFYIFNEKEKIEKTIDFNGYKFLDSDIKRTTFYKVLSETFYGTQDPYSIEKITSDSPISLALTRKKRKVYLDNINNKLTFTFDNNTLYTQLIIVDLVTFLASEKMIKKPDLITEVPLELYEMQSNSFLFEDKLIQIKSSPDVMKFSIKNLDNIILNENTIYSDKVIEIKNSDIFLEYRSSKNKRIIETSKFVRKVNNQTPAISCYKQGENLLIRIGSVSQIKQEMNGGFLAGAIIGGAIGGAIMMASVTMENFNPYANREIAYVNCLFDQTGKHINGTTRELAFEKIRYFLEDTKDLSSQTIFKLDNAYYLGFFEKKSSEYSIRKFVD